MTSKATRALANSDSHSQARCVISPAPSVDALLRRAEAACLRAGEQLSPLRRGLLAVFGTCNGPVGVYDLAPICSDRLGRAIYPSSIYRVLKFWCRLDVVTHLSEHNTFVLTSALRGTEAHVVFVCTSCGSARQCGDETMRAALGRIAQSLNFSPSGKPIEIEGQCARCRG